MEALTRAPLRVTLAVAPGDPGLAGSVQEVLSTQDVDAQEELWVLDGAVHMALGREVDHIVYVVVAEQAVGQLAVAYVALDKEAAAVVYIVLDGAQVARVGEGIEHDDLDVVIDILLV